MIKSALFIIVLWFTISTWAYLPKEGIVPNKDVAVKIAEIVLQQLYGDLLLEQKPFTAVLTNGVWNIDGTFHCKTGSGCKGGAAHIEIQKSDGRILNVQHGK